MRNKWVREHKVSKNRLLPKPRWLRFGFPRSYNPDLLYTVRSWRNHPHFLNSTAMHRITSYNVCYTKLLRSYYRDPADTEKQVSRLLKLKDRPTCILVPDDFALLGAIKAINEAGLSYPEDVSLAGYDGIPMAKIISPSITTIEQDSYNLGLKAAEKLINSIDGIEEERITIVKGRLIEGESVYKLRNDK